MKLTDIIKQPTRYINPPVQAATQTVAATVNKAVNNAVNSEPATEATEPETPATLSAIESAAEINANLYASLVETPLTAFNSIRYRLSRKKAKKTITDTILLDKELKSLEKTYNENKTFIEVDDIEFARFHKIAMLKAKRDGGKVNENADMASAIMLMIAKRAVIFVKE